MPPPDAPLPAPLALALAETRAGRAPLPPLDRERSRLVDRLLVERLAIPSVLLMENAGRGATEHVAERARALGAGTPQRPIAILCGAGNNGGDGAVIARHLACAGLAVELFHFRPLARLTGDAAIQRRIVDALALPARAIASAEDWAEDWAEGCAEGWAAAEGPLRRAGLLVDGLLGTGFRGTPREALARVLDGVGQVRAETGAELIALDIPSGLDCDAGTPATPCLRADRTLTFCSPKTGFEAPGAADWTGPVEVVGLGVPDSAIAALLLASEGTASASVL